MRAILVLSLYIGWILPLNAANADVKPNMKKDIAEDKALLAQPPIDWIKTYSLSPFSESWTVNVLVKRLETDLPKVMKVLESDKATLTIPLGQSVGSGRDQSQQLTYKLSEKAARDALKKLRKIGSTGEPTIRHNGELVSLSEVGRKLDRLTTERNMHRLELNSMPSIAAMTDEMIQHLSMVKQVRETVDTQVLLNLTVRQKP